MLLGLLLATASVSAAFGGFIENRGQLATSDNYFLGSGPARWHADVPAFAETLYRDLWPGVDLVWREENGSLTDEPLALEPGGRR